MRTKPEVLLFAEWFLPGNKAGGPITAIDNITKLIGDSFCIKIITRDHDFGEKKKYQNIVSNQWIKLPDYSINYLSGSILILLRLFLFARKEKNCVFHLNSFFSPYFSIWILLLCKFKLLKPVKIIISPRGELHLNALEYKSIKKKIFLALDKMLKLHSNLVWQVSSAIEKDEVKRIISDKAQVKIIPDIIDFSWKDREIAFRLKETNVLKIIYLSRIHPTKNLEFALSIVKQLRGKIIFDIYGPIEVEEYWQKCKDIITDNSLSNSIKYMGILSKNEVIETLSKYHIFFFPTQNENFGHVIAESLQAGVPVITSDKTPWKDLLKNRAGYDLSLEQPENIITALKQFQSMDQREYNNWVKGTRDYLNAKFNYNEIKQRYYDLFSI